MIGVSKDQTVGDLETIVSDRTGIPVDRLVILLRHEQVNSSYRVEYFNMDWRQPKRLSECSKLEHGWTLWVANEDKNGRFDTFGWKKEFDQEADKITLKFNDPREEEYSSKISVLKTDSLLKVKELISTRLGLPVEGFYLRSAFDRELKETSKSVQAHGLTQGAALRVELGALKNEGYYVL